jgi:hypothetical protein
MTPGPFSYKPYKNGPNWAFYNGEELVTLTPYRKGCEGIAKLIKELAPDAVILPYQRPPQSHADRVQENRTGIYDTKRKGR